jgi:class 3 adenylate cyclase
MRGVVFSNSGTVDKFIEDTLVVIFGAPVAMTPQEQVQHATRCSAQMQDALENLNQAWLEDGITEFQLQIGMDYAEATVGDFGTDEHSDYTAIGPPVKGANQIANVCEAGQIYGSEALIQHLPESWGHEEVGDESGETTLYRLILEK